MHTHFRSVLHHKSGHRPTTDKSMKKHSTFSTRNEHQIQLSEELKRLEKAIREAESALEFEMAMQDLDRIIQGQESLEDQSGA